MILGTGGRVAIDLSPQQIAAARPPLPSRGCHPMCRGCSHVLGAAILRTPSQASCTPSTGAHGCLGCDGGFTEGAYEYLQSVAGLANAFYIPYRQSLTRTSSTKAWPTLA